MLIESLKVEGVSACIHCSHNVGVGKPFETVTVIKKAVQINLTCKCVPLLLLVSKDGGAEGWRGRERGVLMEQGDDGDSAGRHTRWIDCHVCHLPPS